MPHALFAVLAALVLFPWQCRAFEVQTMAIPGHYILVTVLEAPGEPPTDHQTLKELVYAEAYKVRAQQFELQVARGDDLDKAWVRTVGASTSQGDFVFSDLDEPVSIWSVRQIWGYWTTFQDLHHLMTRGPDAVTRYFYQVPCRMQLRLENLESTEKGSKLASLWVDREAGKRVEVIFPREPKYDGLRDGDEIEVQTKVVGHDKQTVIILAYLVNTAEIDGK